MATNYSLVESADDLLILASEDLAGRLADPANLRWKVERGAAVVFHPASGFPHSAFDLKGTLTANSPSRMAALQRRPLLIQLGVPLKDEDLDPVVIQPA